MNKTLIEGLNEKTLQAKVNRIDVNGFQFGKLFPVRKVNAFTWKTLANQLGQKNVAADIHADNSTIVRKQRPIFESATGDLPHIAISREMRRSELKEYQTALALAGDANATELVRFWADDVEFCFNGVQSELEYIALALASNAGVLAFTNENNTGVVTEFNLDYQVDDNALLSVTTPFSDKAGADVIGAFINAVKEGKKQGKNIKYAFMNLDEFYKIATCDQIIKQCASYVQNLTGTMRTPTLEDVNSMLRGQAWLNGLQLRVIDQTITREHFDGTYTAANPFADNRIVFAESEVLGSTQYDVLNSDDNVVMKSVRSHTTVKKYSIPEPLTEVTLAEADACPVFDTAYKNMYLRTDGSGWGD